MHASQPAVLGDLQATRSHRHLPDLHDDRYPRRRLLLPQSLLPAVTRRGRFRTSTSPSKILELIGVDIVLACGFVRWHRGDSGTRIESEGKTAAGDGEGSGSRSGSVQRDDADGREGRTRRFTNTCDSGGGGAAA